MAVQAGSAHFIVIRCLVTFLAMHVTVGQLFPDAQYKPGREVSLPPEEVKDTLLAYVLGIIHGGFEVELDNQFLREILTEFKTSASLPFDEVTSVSQLKVPGTPYEILTVAFRQEMKIPVPFSLLGYHPGWIRASEKVAFTEVRSASRALDDGSALSPFYVFRLTEGYAAIDVDEWITFLFSSIIDDITIRVLAVFRYKDHWYCMMDGTGRRGQIIAGLLDFRTNAITFPLPGEMKELAEVLLIEARLAAGGIPSPLYQFAGPDLTFIPPEARSSWWQFRHAPL